MSAAAGRAPSRPAIPAALARILTLEPDLAYPHAKKQGAAQVSSPGSEKQIPIDGRWLFGVIDKDPTEATEGESTLERTQMGMRGGYPIFKERGHLETWSVAIHWSDDDGKSWREGEPIKGPFKWACPATWHFIERPDGEVWLPMYGCVTDEEVDSYSGSNCIIRSRDRGETWGDSTLIFRTNPPRPDDFQSEPRFTEKEFVVFTAVSHRSDASAGVYRWIEN